MNDIASDNLPMSLFTQPELESNLPSDKHLAKQPSVTPEHLSQIKKDNKPLSQKPPARIEAIDSEPDEPRNTNDAVPTPPARADEVREVMIREIKVDPEVQQRAGTNPQVISDYGDILSDKQWPKSKWPFPPLDVFKTQEGLVLADGFHRFDAACKVLGDDRGAEATVSCRVREGTRDDALLFAVGANAKHGLPRTNADKRRAVQTLLRHPEWSQWSSRVIAEKARVSHWLVNELRGELQPSAPEAEPSQADDQFNAIGSPSGALDVGDTGPASQKVNSTGSSSSGLDVNGAEEPVEQRQPPLVDPPEKRKAKDGRLMTVRSSGPSPNSSRQSSNKPASNAASKTQRSLSAQDPQRRIDDLSSALLACRDESLSHSDHFKVAHRLVPSLKHALERCLVQDAILLVKPLLEWHEQHAGEPHEGSDDYDNPSGDANVEENAEAQPA